MLEEKAGMPLPEVLEKAQKQVRDTKKTELLAGLGDLLDNKQRVWVREKLQDELLFLLSLYANIHGNAGKNNHS